MGAVLSLSGGFMDAYSYLCRGHVFANAQTGNLLLFSVHLSNGEWSDAGRYLLPLAAFALGVALAECARRAFAGTVRVHWRQLVVLAEVLVLLGVAFLPQSRNAAANALTSLACGAQVESFRKVNGSGVATTMCIGNLRAAVQSGCDFFFTGETAAGRRGALYLGVIGAFAAGAVLGQRCVTLAAEHAILVSSALCLAGFCLMLARRET